MFRDGEMLTEVVTHTKKKEHPLRVLPFTDFFGLPIKQQALHRNPTCSTPHNRRYR